MKRPLAYITAAWCGDPDTDMELAARYCRMAYEAGFSPICPILYLPLFINDAINSCIDQSTLALLIASRRKGIRQSTQRNAHSSTEAASTFSTALHIPASVAGRFSTAVLSLS